MSNFYKKNKVLDIAVDFDGTCVYYAYPHVGRPIGAYSVLKDLIERGHRLILYTMRTGEQLEDAKRWFEDNQLSLYGVQYNPTQSNWTTSNKCYAHIYIDDAALGCPLIYQEGERPYVDWDKIREILKERGVL